jgi:hypothetical protein
MRAVNRICFNPTHGSTLLSASQDCTMKLWVSNFNINLNKNFQNNFKNTRISLLGFKRIGSSKIYFRRKM